MDTNAADWNARWNEGRIGFHEGVPNAQLVRHASVLGEARRVLVPLCGKAEDLAYLASLGHEVVGVELVARAIDAFFAEHDLAPTRASVGGFEVTSAGGVHLVRGDMLAVTREVLGPVDALYDRAALIALPPETRVAYTSHLRQLLPSGARGLVIGFEYPQATMSGPPFAVDEAELRRHFAGLATEVLEREPSSNERLAAAGVTPTSVALRVTF